MHRGSALVGWNHSGLPEPIDPGIPFLFKQVRKVQSGLILAMNGCSSEPVNCLRLVAFHALALAIPLAEIRLGPWVRLLSRETHPVQRLLVFPWVLLGQ